MSMLELPATYTAPLPLLHFSVKTEGHAGNRVVLLVCCLLLLLQVVVDPAHDKSKVALISGAVAEAEIIAQPTCSMLEQR
jgi:hypothetical protein